MKSLLLKFSLLPCFLFAAVANATDDKDAEALAFARKKLEVAKKAWKAEAEACEKSIADQFDKLEAAARELGDAKAVERIKLERAAFKKYGELPVKVERPKTIGDARKRMADSYAEAGRDFLRLKLDGDVAATAAEHEAFLLDSANLSGKRAFLSTLKPLGVKVENRWFSSNGKWGEHPILRNGEPSPHALYMVPISNATGEANYTLAGKYTRFIAEVGVPKIGDDAHDPATGLVFEVLGDGKSLWKSKPAVKTDELQKLDVRVDKVKTLQLRVNCAGPNAWARSAWYEPVVIEP